MERICASCGAVLGLNRSKVCRECKQKKEFVEKEKAKREQIDALHEAGFVLLHSCIGPADPFLESCACRQKLTLAEAREMASKGEIIDLEKRVAYFFGKGKDLLTSSKRKQVPRTSTIDRTQIQRATQDIKWQKKARQIYRSPEEIDADRQAEYRDLQTKIQEDNFQRSEEEKYRWAVWQDLSKEFYQSLIRFVPEKEYDDLERSQRGIPVIQAPLGQDERTDIGRAWETNLPQTRIAGLDEFEMGDGGEDAETTDNDQETVETPKSLDDDDAEVIFIDRLFTGEDQEIEEEDVEAA
jgi:hypothetical protein